MTRHTSKLLPLLAALLLWAPGCRSQAANVMKLRAEGGTVDIQVLNEGLQDDLELVSGRVAYEGDVMVGWVRVRNHEDEKMPFEYRWLWYDADDKKISIGGGSESWSKGWANPLEEVEVDGHAPAEGAVRTEFQLRYAPE